MKLGRIICTKELARIWIIVHLGSYNSNICHLLDVEVVFSFRRATSHTRLRARDHYTSSTPIGGKKAERVQVHFTQRLRDQRSEYLNARWM
jgi:hypothetical protein